MGQKATGFGVRSLVAQPPATSTATLRKFMPLLCVLIGRKPGGAPASNALTAAAIRPWSPRAGTIAKRSVRSLALRLGARNCLCMTDLAASQQLPRCWTAFTRGLWLIRCSSHS